MDEIYKKLGLRMLVLITDCEGGAKAEDAMQKAGMHVQYCCQGRGTATSDILDYLGFDGGEKTVIFCIMPKVLVPGLLRFLKMNLQLKKPGTGIAFTLSINGASGRLMKQLDADAREYIINQAESEVKQMEEKSLYSLVMVITDQGYSEDIMDTARKAGAQGGTILNVRRAGLEEAMKVWGISIQEKKEMLMILVPKEKKSGIMQAIGEKHGRDSKAHSMVISMPVDQVEGL